MPMSIKKLHMLLITYNLATGALAYILIIWLSWLKRPSSLSVILIRFSLPFLEDTPY